MVALEENYFPRKDEKEREKVCGWVKKQVSTLIDQLGMSLGMILTVGASSACCACSQALLQFCSTHLPTTGSIGQGQLTTVFSPVATYLKATHLPYKAICLQKYNGSGGSLMWKYMDWMST